jgi:hypothetical protein
MNELLYGDYNADNLLKGKLRSDWITIFYLYDFSLNQCLYICFDQFWMLTYNQHIQVSNLILILDFKYTNIWLPLLVQYQRSRSNGT